jgi:hypothetical protein
MARRYRRRIGRGTGFNPNFRRCSDMLNSALRAEDEGSAPELAIEPTPDPGPDPDPEPPAYLGQPMAYVLFGGNGNFPETGYNGIAHFDEWAELAGPIFQRHGITRVYMQNPAGVYPEFPDTDMRCNQWLIAEQRGFSFANRAELRTAFEILASYGIVNVLCYIGSPYQLADPVTELPLCVEPFIDAADGILDLTMGFDALFYDILLPPGVTDFYPANWQPDSPRTLAIEALPCDVYAEARLEADMLAAGVDAYVEGTIAMNDYDETHVVDYSEQPGETIRITAYRLIWDGWPEVADWEEGIVPAYRSVHNWGPTSP